MLPWSSSSNLLPYPRSIISAPDVANTARHTGNTTGPPRHRQDLRPERNKEAE